MKKVLKLILLLIIVVSVFFPVPNSFQVSANQTQFQENDEIISDSVVIPDKFNTGPKGILEVMPEETVKGNDEGTITFTWRGSYYSVNIAAIKSEVVVIENKEFTHRISFINEGGINKKIIFRNCKFKSVAVGRVGFEDWEVVFENCSFEHAFGSNLTFHNCYFGGSVSDGLNPFQNVKVYDSFFSNLAHPSDEPVENKTHSDATQMYGYTGNYKGEEIVLDVENIYFYNCRMEVPNIPFTNSAGYVNAALMIQPEYADLHDVKFEKCIINGGGYSIYISAKNGRIVRDLTLEDVKVGASAWYGELYKGGVAVPTSLFPERNIIYNTSKTDKLYVGSVWKEADGVHISVTNDSAKDRILTVELANGTKKEFPIRATYPGTTWWQGKFVTESRDKYTYEDFPIDVEIVVESTSYIRCYDDGTLIRTQTFSDVEEITLNKKTVKMDVGESFNLTANVPLEELYKNLTWSSSNDKVVTVDQNGKVTAVSNGIAIVTVGTSNGLTATCAILVGHINLEGKLNLSGVYLAMKHSMMLKFSPIYVIAVKMSDSYSRFYLSYSSFVNRK